MVGIITRDLSGQPREHRRPRLQANNIWLQHLKRPRYPRSGLVTRIAAVTNALCKISLRTRRSALRRPSPRPPALFSAATVDLRRGQRCSSQHVASAKVHLHRGHHRRFSLWPLRLVTTAPAALHCFLWWATTNFATARSPSSALSSAVNPDAALRVGPADVRRCRRRFSLRSQPVVVDSRRG